MKKYFDEFLFAAMCILAAIALNSCKKSNFRSFEGKWQIKSKYVCQGMAPVVIEFDKRIGMKGKNSNLYTVSSASGLMNCMVTGDNKIDDSFEIESYGESAESARATSKKYKGMEMYVSGNELVVSYAGVFLNGNGIVLKRSQ